MRSCFCFQDGDETMRKQQLERQLCSRDDGHRCWYSQRCRDDDKVSISSPATKKPWSCRVQLVQLVHSCRSGEAVRRRCSHRERLFRTRPQWGRRRCSQTEIRILSSTVLHIYRSYSRFGPVAWELCLESSRFFFEICSFIIRASLSEAVFYLEWWLPRRVSLTLRCPVNATSIVICAGKPSGSLSLVLWIAWLFSSSSCL